MIAYFDIAALLLMLFLALRALSRGFVQEVLTLGMFFGGIIAAALLSGSVANIIAPLIDAVLWSQIIAFLLVFVVVYATLSMFHRWLARTLESINLVNLDRALGFIFGVAEGAALIVALLLIISIIPFVNENKFLQDSVIARLARPFVPALRSLLQN